jgi:hypothetical protein
MGSTIIFKKALNFAKDKIEEAAIEISNDVVDKLKNKAKETSNEAIDMLKNKACDMIDSSKPTNKNYTKDAVIEKSRSLDNIAVKDSMTNEEEEIFIGNLTSSLRNVGLSAINDQKQALEVVKKLVQATDEVAKFQELQITKRSEIESIRQQALAKIDMQKSLLMTYLERTFDERKEIFKQYFKVVDAALSSGNIQQLAIGLDSINTLAASSPFKNLASIENTGKALDDPNTEWEF